MKSYVYGGSGKTKIRNVEKPVLQKGGAITRITTASICGTDLRIYKHGNEKIQNGRIIGHEACHIIQEIDNASGFKTGDRIIVAPAIGCGKCESCRRGHTNMCDSLKTIGFEYDGTFAEYCAIPAQAFMMGNVIPVPENISDAEACIAEPVACAVNGQSFLNIAKGENVLIYGAGYLGCIHAELARLKGARIVIIAELAQKRREQAQKLISGIYTLDPSKSDFEKCIKDLVGGAGIDIVITACPSGLTHRQALELVNKNGRVSLFGGLPGEGSGFLDSNLIHYKEIGVFGVHASTPKHNEESLSYISRGELQVKKYTREFALNDIEEAFAGLSREQVIKALLIP